MGITIRILQANHGDSILVTHEGSDGIFNMLIDGGDGATFKSGPRGRNPGALQIALDQLKRSGQHIDLAILTHIDDDHINGLLKGFETPGYLSDMVKAIWFNSSHIINKFFSFPEIPENAVTLTSDVAETSIKQGKDLDKWLTEIGCERAPVVIAGKPFKKGPFEFTILSPDSEKLEKLLHKWPAGSDSGDTSTDSNDYSLSINQLLASDTFREDGSVYNGSSIAFIVKADNKAMLFLGDAHDELVVRSLRALGARPDNRLELELIKISHHGSQFNTSPEFLSLVDSKRFIISTDGSRHGLPNKRTIARILEGTEGQIYFNYEYVMRQLLLPSESVFLARFEVLSDDLRI